MINNNGFVEIIAPLRPKNDANFPVVESKYVSVGEGDNKKTLNQILGNVDEEIDKVGTISDRISNIEELVGLKAEGEAVHSIAQRISALEEALGLKSDTTTTSSLSSRLQNIEYTFTSKVGLSVAEKPTESSTDSGTSGTSTDDTEGSGSGSSSSSDPTLVSRITDNESAIASLNNSISSEATARETGISNVSNALDAANRLHATDINNIQTVITTETTNRKKAISDEVAARNAALSDINTRIDSIESSLGGSGEGTGIGSRISSLESSSSDYAARIASIENQMVGFSGSSKIVSSTDEMTDHNLIYINTTNGQWYYWNETSSSFVSGGSIGGIYIDSELKTQGSAADAKVTGDKIAAIAGRVGNVENKVTQLGYTVINGVSVFCTFNTEGNKVIERTDNNGNVYYAGSISNDAIKLSGITTSEWVALNVDANSNIISGVDYDGNQFFFGDVYANNINKMQSLINKLMKEVAVLRAASGNSLPFE